MQYISVRWLYLHITDISLGNKIWSMQYKWKCWTLRAGPYEVQDNIDLFVLYIYI